MSWNSKT